MSNSTYRTKTGHERQTEAAVQAQFLERWSPRAFAAAPVPDELLASLFEAARWAPSCFNEQPWFFVWGNTPAALELLRPVLVEANRAWAERAPVLVLAFARKNFAKNGQPNRWAAFDSGSAWMSLALQAQALGLATHAMGGFDERRALEVAGLDAAQYEALAAIAIGYAGDPSSLPPALAQREAPSPRKPLAQVARRL